MSLITKTQLKGYATKYNKGYGLTILANTAGVSVSTMRKYLADYGVTIRGRGRPKGS